MQGHDAVLWKRKTSQFQTDFLIRAHIPEWLGKVEGKTILDAGCGEGYVSRMLSSLRANVYGFDKDPKMIGIAKGIEAENPIGVDYRICDVFEIEKAYKKHRFDFVLLIGVSCFFDKKKLVECINKVASMLKPGGVLLLSTNHPGSYFKKAKSNWLRYNTVPGKNLSSQVVYIDFYSPKREKVFSGECWMHPVEDIKKAINGANLEVVDVYEPLASQEDLKHFPNMWADEDWIPFHIAFKAVKKRLKVKA